MKFKIQTPKFRIIFRPRGRSAQTEDEASKASKQKECELVVKYL